MGKRRASEGRKILAARCTPSRMGTLTCKCLTISGADAEAVRLTQASDTTSDERTVFLNAEVTQLPYYVPSNWPSRQHRARPEEAAHRIRRHGFLRFPKRAVPMRMKVAPSSIA